MNNTTQETNPSALSEAELLQLGERAFRGLGLPADDARVVRRSCWTWP